MFLTLVLMLVLMLASFELTYALKVEIFFVFVVIEPLRVLIATLFVEILFEF